MRDGAIQRVGGWLACALFAGLLAYAFLFEGERESSVGRDCRKQVERAGPSPGPGALRADGYDPRADAWVACMTAQPGGWECPANDPREFSGQPPRPAAFCYRGPAQDFIASADNPFVAENTYVSP